MAATWYLAGRLVDYRKQGPQGSRGLLTDLRPDNYTPDGLPLLFRYWASLIITLICWVFVVGVLHP
jgi:hypothetical protein